MPTKDSLTQKHIWTSKSLGFSLQHKFFYLLVRLRLVPLARLLLYPVAGYYALHPKIRKRYSYYLRHRFGDLNLLQRIFLTARAYKNFADVLLDKTLVRILGKTRLRQNEQTLSLVKSIIAEGRGCLIVSAHFGSWQSASTGLESLGRPIRIVQWLEKGDVDGQFFQSDGRIGYIDARKGIETIIDIRNALQNNEIVCMMGDRLAPGEKESVSLPFLGEEIAIPIAPYVIASSFAVPIVHAFSVLQDGVVCGLDPVWTRFDGKGRKNPAAIREAAKRFLSRLESLVEIYPCHFFNFYDLWADKR